MDVRDIRLPILAIQLHCKIGVMIWYFLFKAALHNLLHFLSHLFLHCCIIAERFWSEKFISTVTQVVSLRIVQTDMSFRVWACLDFFPPFFLQNKWFLNLWPTTTSAVPSPPLNTTCYEERHSVKADQYLYDRQLNKMSNWGDFNLWLPLRSNYGDRSNMTPQHIQSVTKINLLLCCSLRS